MTPLQLLVTAVSTSNILVAKVTGGYFPCFIWPQRHGSKEKQGIYKSEQGIYKKQIPANSQSYFSIRLVYNLMLS